MISEGAVLLAGFVLAHAVWSVSDLPEGELLVPLAVIEADGERQLVRFEAETQEEAIANGKARMVEVQASSSTWALAREGLMRSRDGSAIDVIIVEAWEPGMDEPLTFIQPFQPFATGEFKLLGSAVPVVDGQMLSEEAAPPYLAVLHRGITGHSKVAPLWPTWQ